MLLSTYGIFASGNNLIVSDLVINSIGPQDGDDGDVPVDYDILPDDPTVEAVLFLSTDPDPDAADFNTGASSGYIDLGQVALTTAGSGINLALPAGLDDTYKLGLLPTGGGTADIAVSAAFALVTPSENLIVKSADETRTSTTTFADDSELVSATLDANSTYLVKAHPRWAADATPDIKFTLGRTGLSDATIYWQAAEGIRAPAGTGINANTWGTTESGTGAGDAVVRHSAFFGVVRTGTDPGTVGLQWAQTGSSANNTKVLAGSIFVIEKAA